MDHDLRQHRICTIVTRLLVFCGHGVRIVKLQHAFGGCLRVLALGAAVMMAATWCYASDALVAQRPAIYKPQPDACYVQLRPSWAEKPYTASVKGEDQPVCRAVLRNLNKFCGQPGDQDLPLLHPSTKDITLPQWKPLNPADNLDLVREAITAGSNTPELKSQYWKELESRVKTWVKEDRVLLMTTDIRLHEKSSIYTVYLIDKTKVNDDEINRTVGLPIFFLSKQGKRTQVKNSIGFAAYGYLWKFDNHWFVVGGRDAILFGPDDVRLAMTVALLNDSVHLSQVIACTIQSTNIYNRGR